MKMYVERDFIGDDKGISDSHLSKMPTAPADDYSDRLTLGTTTPSEDMTHEDTQTSEFTSSASDGEAPQRESKETAESEQKKENIKQ